VLSASGIWCVARIARFSTGTRPMFRFTIRDVLWLMAVVGVALSLLLGWLRGAARLRATTRQLQNAEQLESWLLKSLDDGNNKIMRLEAEVGRLKGETTDHSSSTNSGR